MGKQANFYVLGSHKTATSTIVGILNCHPKLYCYYEFVVDGNKIKPKAIRKRSKLINPDQYKWIGDKNPILGIMSETDKRIAKHNKYKIVFTYRNLDEWLSHISIQDIYNTKEDVVKPTISYIYYLMKSYDLDNCLRLKTEDILFDPYTSVDKLAKFFGVDAEPMYDWWDKVGQWKDVNKNKYKFLLNTQMPKGRNKRYGIRFRKTGVSSKKFSPIASNLSSGLLAQPVD